METKTENLSDQAQMKSRDLANYISENSDYHFALGGIKYSNEGITIFCSVVGDSKLLETLTEVIKSDERIKKLLSSALLLSEI